MKPYYIALAFALVTNACANILIKTGMKGGLPQGAGVSGIVRGILLNPIVVAGVVLFGLQMVFYAYALSRIPLSTAYPLMTSVGFLIVVTASVVMLNETLSLIQVLGLILIMAGVAMVASRLA